MVVMKALGFQVKKKEVLQLINKVDKEGNLS